MGQQTNCLWLDLNIGDYTRKYGIIQWMKCRWYVLCYYKYIVIQVHKSIKPTGGGSIGSKFLCGLFHWAVYADYYRHIALCPLHCNTIWISTGKWLASSVTFGCSLDTKSLGFVTSSDKLGKFDNVKPKMNNFSLYYLLNITLINCQFGAKICFIKQLSLTRYSVALWSQQCNSFINHYN